MSARLEIMWAGIVLWWIAYLVFLIFESHNKARLKKVYTALDRQWRRKRGGYCSFVRHRTIR